MTNLLGGHVEIASANPGEALPQIEAKKVRLLAMGGDKRFDDAAFKDVPTLKELGIDASLQPDPHDRRLRPASPTARGPTGRTVLRR